GAVVKALQTKGLFQSLAEPNLVAESGKEASFLAGGEFPVPVVQGAGGSMAVSVMFKEFGIRLNFTPNVIGDRVHLKVRPEVSTLDFNNAVVLQGFRIPALSTRRTETELELLDGQTFAIAGLMNNKVASAMQKIPGIGDIPIIGNLFKSKAAQKEQTELVVMITPEILKTNTPGVTPSLPRVPEKFMDPLPDSKLKDMPAPAFSGIVSPAPAAAAASRPAPASAGKASKGKSAEKAASAVSSLVPSGPKVVGGNGGPAAAGTAPSAAPAPVLAPAPAPAPAAAVAPAAPAAEPVPVAAAPAVEPVVASAPGVMLPDTLRATPARADQAELVPVELKPLDEDAPIEPAPAAPPQDDAALARAAREQMRREEALRKAHEAEAKERQKEEAAAQKRAAKAKAEADKLAADQARKDADAARKQAEAERKNAEADRKRAEAG
ncbi:MAG: hypothetical protein AB7I13_14655, partial [Vicinamibacterales bacterium]